MSYQQTYGRGLGATPGQLISTAAGSAGAIGGALIGGPAGLAVSAGVSIVTSLLQGVINGCGSTCEVTSTWANEVEAALQQNITAYFNLPTPRSTTDQAASLANFDNAWAALVQQCNNPNLGSAGQNCISDRQAGACHWTQPASAVPPWGTPAAGACWNWFSGYRDPIANDPNVSADVAVPASISTANEAIANLLPGSGLNLETIGLIAAGAVVVWLVLK